MSSAESWKISYVFWEFGGPMDNVAIGFVIYERRGGKYAWRLTDPREKLPHVHPQLAEWVRCIAENRVRQVVEEGWGDEEFREHSGRSHGDGNVWLSWSETSVVFIREGQPPEEVADGMAAAVLSARDITRITKGGEGRE